MIIYRICIPSYKRANLIRERTLRLLNIYNVPKQLIDIIVETEEMKSEYINSIGSEYNIIVSNTKGVGQKRNFVRKFYQQETDVKYLVCLDDDLVQILDMDKPLESFQEFEKIILTGFDECEKHCCDLWGVSPLTNPFFMKRKVTSNLKYICGAIFGLIIDRAVPPIQTQFDHGEDHDFTIQHFLRDDAVIRLNWVCFKTDYFVDNGGITTYSGGVAARKEEAEINCKKLASMYPDMISYDENKWGPSIKYNWRFKNS